jgi:hypothetical protein
MNESASSVLLGVWLLDESDEEDAPDVLSIADG